MCQFPSNSLSISVVALVNGYWLMNASKQPPVLLNDQCMVSLSSTRYDQKQVALTVY